MVSEAAVGTCERATADVSTPLELNQTQVRHLRFVRGPILRLTCVPGYLSCSSYGCGAARLCRHVLQMRMLQDLPAQASHRQRKHHIGRVSQVSAG